VRSFDGWRIAALIATGPPVLVTLVPAARSEPFFLALAQLGIGTLVALGVGSTVTRFANPSTWPGRVSADHARRVYRSQKRVGFVLSLLLAALLAWGAVDGRFTAMGGWLLLPVVFIAPLLHARDRRR